MIFSPARVTEQQHCLQDLCHTPTPKVSGHVGDHFPVCGHCVPAHAIGQTLLPPGIHEVDQKGGRGKDLFAQGFWRPGRLKFLPQRLDD